MIFRDESQIVQNIKLGHLYRVYLLYGEEKYLKDLYKSRLMKLAVGENFQEFNLHVFDGNDLDINKVLEACEAMPFMTEQRCVVVEKFDYEGLSIKDKNKVDELLKEPVESTVLILVVDKELLPKKSSKAKKLIELCDKAGAVCELKKRSAGDIAKFLRSRAESRKCTITRELCDYILSRCENDLLSLSNEMEKITAYAKAVSSTADSTVTPIEKQHIDAVTCKAIGASIYDLAKAILAERFEKAMEIAENLIYLKYQPTTILAALSGAYVDLYIAKIAKNAGKGEEDIKKAFSYRGREFLIRMNLRDCSKFQTNVLRESVRLLGEVDFRMKSSRADNTIILEQTITELFLIANRQP